MAATFDKSGSRSDDGAMNAPRRAMPSEAQRMIDELGVAFVATTRPDGTPNVSPKGTLKVVDDTTLAFADIASPGTMRNIRHCPEVEINVVDPFRRRGWRFRGRAEISTDETLIAFLTAGLNEPYPVRAAVLVRVQETRTLLSPVYTIHKADEDAVRRRWEDRFGYIRKPAEPGAATPNQSKSGRVAHD